MKDKKEEPFAYADVFPFLKQEQSVPLQDIKPNLFLYGLFFIFISFALFTTFMYAMIVSKFMPDTGNVLLDWIKYDQYYCFVAPSTCFVIGIFFVLNWISFKFFQHAS
eukprot:TRINITY_DN8951_c0_g1_i1.p1 TRINITY_DN8951_c0_g1~~TRINITY_DN8951_c0_g1_i1.p1  ORF type:complete len:118 (+),score=16.42 TRINITY_DN8951_c0_g1_i1:33-356(+)